MRNAKTPTLIFKAKTIRSIPQGQSQELYRGLKRYGVESELVLYPRESHGFQEAKHRVDVQKRVVAWFDSHLGKQGKSETKTKNRKIDPGETGVRQLSSAPAKSRKAMRKNESDWREVWPYSDRSICHRMW